MGIYKGQFLVGDRIEYYEEEYWIISIQQIGGELVYVLMSDNLKVKTVSTCNLGENDIFKLTRRIVLGNKEVLCNLCPLRKSLDDCSNFCDYNKTDLDYFFVGDRIVLNLLPKGWEEVTAITLRDVNLTTHIKYCRPFLEVRSDYYYSLIPNLSRLIEENKEDIMKSLIRGVTGIDTIVFFGKNYEPIRKTDFKLKLRTKFAQNKESHIDYFKELLCDYNELEEFKNRWKLWLE